MKWIDWIAEYSPRKLLGLYGVGEEERPIVRAIGKLYIYSSVLVASILLWEWQLERFHQLDPVVRDTLNGFIWLFFLSQWVVLLVLSEHRWKFLRRNWMIAIIVLFGLPFLFDYAPIMAWTQPLRAVLALLILIPFCPDVWRFFIDGKLSTTMLAVLVIVVIFGLLVAGIDPGITTAWDGIWWAIATVSSVGYGDVVPVSPLGRLLGSGLIIIGFVFFVAITSNVLSLMLRRETKLLKKEEQEIAQLLLEVDKLKRGQEEIVTVLNQMETRLARFK